MIHRILAIGFIIALTCSCENKNIAKFEITNRTNDRIDSLRIVPNGYESKHYISLLPGETKKYDCDMTNIAKVDGDYQIDYKFESSDFISETFGYYTNGYPIEKLNKIEIKTNTLLFDAEFNSY
ncbi:hypothetical protein [Marinifilum fragile]|uniref:hypothetical protein n=1 Tax=Marinifilum fragile TaxID=570161 RepID=UPI0006D0F0CF|nr:hypothetical protein [Marinifilum fragile]